VHCDPFSRAYASRHASEIRIDRAFSCGSIRIAMPANVTLDCRHLHCADHSAIAALEALHARYAKLGKRLRLTDLPVRNWRLLQRADAGVVMRQEGN
jgi:SulP family sulfate permease